MIVDSDNYGAINIADNGIISNRTKHIDIKHHFLKHTIESNSIALRKCTSTSNTADTFTKALPYPRFAECRREMGMEEI